MGSMRFMARGYVGAKMLEKMRNKTDQMENYVETPKLA